MRTAYDTYLNFPELPQRTQRFYLFLLTADYAEGFDHEGTPRYLLSRVRRGDKEDTKMQKRDKKTVKKVLFLTTDFTEK